MTIAVANTSVPFGAVAVYNIISTLDRVRVAILTWNARRVTTNALVRLSDAQMSDIGLTFSDIRSLPLEAGKY